MAVDLLGGDGSPASVISGVITAVRSDPYLTVSLVGPQELSRQGLVDAGDVADRVEIVSATQVVDMDEHPVDGVRDKDDATVCVAADLLSDGSVDAMVSIGSTGAVMAASIFSLGLLPGLTRPALTVTLPAASGEVVLLDVGANVDTSPAVLAQHALLGAAYAQGRLGMAEPKVGLLTIGSEAGKGDATRRAAFDLLGRLPIRFVGNVEGDQVLRGTTADVVVTDGFSGNILLKGMEGTYALLGALLEERLGGAGSELRSAYAQATAHLHPDRAAGALLLGLDGLVVVGHGASSPAAVASCIGQATGAVRRQALPGLRSALAALIPGTSTSLAEATP